MRLAWNTQHTLSDNTRSLVDTPKHKSVARNWGLVCRKVFGMAMAYSPPVDDFTQQGRDEAAAKLSKNKEVVRAGESACTALPVHVGVACT